MIARLADDFLLNSSSTHMHHLSIWQPYHRNLAVLLATHEVWESKEQVGRIRSTRYYHKSVTRTQVVQHRNQVSAAGELNKEGAVKSEVDYETERDHADDGIPVQLDMSVEMLRSKGTTILMLQRAAIIMSCVQAEQVVERQLLTQVRRCIMLVAFLICPFEPIDTPIALILPPPPFF